MPVANLKFTLKNIENNYCNLINNEIVDIFQSSYKASRSYETSSVRMYISILVLLQRLVELMAL